MAENTEIPVEEVNTPPEPTQEEDKALESDGAEAETEQPPAEMPATAEFVADIQSGEKKASHIAILLKELFRNFQLDPEVVSSFKKSSEAIEGGKRKFKALAAHPLIFFSLMGFEFAREKATGNDFGRDFLTSPESHAQLKWMNDVMPTENLGNLAESYAVAAVTFYGVSLLAKDRLSPKMRIAVSLFTSIAVNAYIETHHISWLANTPDVLDIPAGVMGALAFVGMSHIIDRFGTALDQTIDEVKKRIRESKQYFNTLDNANSGSVEGTQLGSEQLAYALATVSENPGAPDGVEQLE